MGDVIKTQEISDQIADLMRRVSSLENQSKKTFGNITIDGNEGQLVFRDSAGDGRILFDGEAGVIKTSEAGVDVRTATDAQLTFLSTYRQLRESTIHTSGGNTFANVAPYVSITDFLTKIDFDDWADMEWYFEATFKAGSGTAHVRLYNTTNSEAVTASQISTTSNSYVSVRSGSIPKYASGERSFVVQYGHNPSGGGTDYINLTIARHIFRRPA